MTNMRGLANQRRPVIIAIIFLVAISFAFAEQQGKTRGLLFVPNAADGTVSALDPHTGSEVWVAAVSSAGDSLPAGAAHGIAISPDGETVYAGDAVTDELVVLNALDGEVIARVALSHAVHGIDIAPDGETVWVGGANRDRFWLGELSVINTESLTVRQVVAPGVGSAAHVSFTPDGRQVWIASTSNNLVWVVNAMDGSLLGLVPLIAGERNEASTPEGRAGYIGINEVAISPDGRTAFAVGPEAATLFRIDVATRRVESVQPGEPRAHGVAVSRNGREVWVANRSGSLSVFDAEQLTPIATVPMGAYANHVSFSVDGNEVYASGDRRLVVVDVATWTIIRSIEVGRDPHEIAVGSSR